MSLIRIHNTIYKNETECGTNNQDKTCVGISKITQNDQEVLVFLQYDSHYQHLRTQLMT